MRRAADGAVAGLAAFLLAAVLAGATPAPAAGVPPATIAHAAQASPAPPSPPHRAPGDTLDLADLHEAVRRLDPRDRQLSLQGEASRARREGLDGRWLPQLQLQAEATYQTDVPSALDDGAGGAPPGGLTVPEPPRDRYDLGLEVRQLLYDGGEVSGSRAVERARLAERTWATRASLYGLREEVDRAFFTALLEQERRRQLRLLREDLDARRELVAARVRAGSLVPAELAAVEAELVRVEQRLDAAGAAQRGALERLSLLLGRDVEAGVVLSVPALDTAAAEARRRLAASGSGAFPGGEPMDPRTASATPWSARPEWRALERRSERLRAQAELADAETRPRASAFVRGAVGRPGLDFFDDAAAPYATAGVRIRWSFFDGGSSGAESRALRLEARAVEAERAALGASLRRRAAAVLHEIDRLARALASDDRLVELEERRRRTALRQLEEGVLLPSEYVERRTDAFEARLRRRIHRVELAAARARLLRILGRDLPGFTAGPGLQVPVSFPTSPSASPTGDRR